MNYLIHNAENVQLTYVIRTRISVEEFQATLDMKHCKICSEDAQVYCENDQEYFCNNCDLLAHEEDEKEY